jgi:hypothetical protein
MSGICAQAQVSDEPAPESRYTLRENCIEVASAVSPDFILNRCDGLDGIPIWWRYSDSARLSVGFGKAAHTSGFFGIDRDPDWPVEWRGTAHSRHFTPYAVIIRMREPFAVETGEPQSFLTVFKLNLDGTSCILESNIRDNARARAIADRAFLEQCESAPDHYRGMSDKLLH